MLEDFGYIEWRIRIIIRRWGGNWKIYLTKLLSKQKRWRKSLLTNYNVNFQ
jgi:hypothetical protein